MSFYKNNSYYIQNSNQGKIHFNKFIFNLHLTITKNKSKNKKSNSRNNTYIRNKKT